MADEASHQRLDQARQALHEPQATVTLKVDLRGLGGARVPVEFNGSVRVDGSGRRIGHVFVGRPLGELKRAQLQLCTPRSWPRWGAWWRVWRMN